MQKFNYNRRKNEEDKEMFGGRHKRELEDKSAILSQEN